MSWGKDARDAARNTSGGSVGGRHRGTAKSGKGGLGRPESGRRGKDTPFRDWYNGKDKQGKR
ncbi:MAG: hypothetical protein ACLQFR_17355 [Streptosporangiaceae bacterium]